MYYIKIVSNDFATHHKNLGDPNLGHDQRLGIVDLEILSRSI